MEQPQRVGQASPASHAMCEPSEAQAENLVKKAASVRDASFREKLLRDALDKIVEGLIQKRTSGWLESGGIPGVPSQDAEGLQNGVTIDAAGRDMAIGFEPKRDSARSDVDSGTGGKVDAVTNAPIGEHDDTAAQIKQEIHPNIHSSNKTQLKTTTGSQSVGGTQRLPHKHVNAKPALVEAAKTTEPLDCGVGNTSAPVKKQAKVKQQEPTKVLQTPVNIDATTVINVLQSPVSPRTPVSRETSIRSVTSDSPSTLSTRSGGHSRTFSTSTEQSIHSQGNSGSPKAAKKPRKIEVRSPPKKTPRKLEVRRGAAKSLDGQKPP